LPHYIDMYHKSVDQMGLISYNLMYFPTLAMFLLNCFADKEPLQPNKTQGEKPSPYLRGSFLSIITFFWIENFMWTSWKKTIEQEDLFSLQDVYTSKEVIVEWEKNLELTRQKSQAKITKDGKNDGTKPSVSVLSALARTFGMEFLIGTIQKFIYDLLSFVSPLILGQLVTFVKDPDQPQWRGFFYAGILGCTSLLMSIFLGQFYTRSFTIGMKVRTAITAAVYRKSLTISNSARKDRTVGEMVNLMSVDAQRLMDLLGYLNVIFSGPTIMIIALYMLWNLLGVCMLAGMGMLVVSLLLNTFLTRFSRKYQIKQMKYKDSRVKTISEILNGMKILKLYAWETFFEEKVLDIRTKEIKQLSKLNYLSAILTAFFSISPFLVQFAMFVTYILVHGSFSAQTVFVSITLMNLLRMPMIMLPFLFVGILQAGVSVNRLNEYLNGGELDPENVDFDTNHKYAVSIENGSFAWDDDDTATETLSNIDLKVTPGSLVAVVGPVGSGKSSLCGAILGNLKKKTGSVKVNSTISFSAQQAWIQNSTLKDNITFGRTYDEKIYTDIINHCSLGPDLKILPDGDMTEIGEKGINLSGGQKQRLSLARAVYAGADIVIMDDPLSAVDSHVGKHMFDNVISNNKGTLKGKTRILVTHSATYLPRMDHIVVMKDGRISEQGSYQELVESEKGVFKEFLLQYLAEGQDQYDEDLVEIKETLEKNLGVKNLDSFVRQRSRQDSTTSTGSRHSQRKKKEDPSTEKLPKPRNKLIEKEFAERGNISWRVYVEYIKCIGVPIFALFVLLSAVSQVSNIGTSLWLAKWSSDGDSDRDTNLAVYAALGLSQALTTLASMGVLVQGIMAASAYLHRTMLANILRGPMEFFDVTPIGRILNRFSKDIDTIDTLLPSNLRSYVQFVIMTLGTVGTVIGKLPIFAAVLVPAIAVYYFFQLVYVTTYRQLKRIESVSRSPIYSHFQESIQGAATIRAFKKQDEFIQLSDTRVDNNQMSYVIQLFANRWVSFRLEQVGNILTTATAIFATLERDTLSPGDMGLTLSYSQSLTFVLYFMVRLASETESSIVSVERIREYTRTPQEAKWEVAETAPPKEWPTEGVVEFKNFSTRYRKGLDLVVKNIDLTIGAGKKVGIVGRTGAGKSSLTLALFRIIEAADGAILIDGVNTSEIGLHSLKRKLAIIPQDPVLFSGTVRDNLDPSETHEDAAIWTALEQAHLKTFMSTLKDGLLSDVQEGGENFSLGQRQLFCLARALLRRAKILVLDEATAAVDLETDDLIQKTIREQFAFCTVITIAHRLNTILDNDLIVVMDKGEIKERGAPQDLLKDPSTEFYSMAADAGLVVKTT